MATFKNSLSLQAIVGLTSSTQLAGSGNFIKVPYLKKNTGFYAFKVVLTQLEFYIMCS